MTHAIQVLAFAKTELESKRDAVLQDTMVPGMDRIDVVCQMTQDINDLNFAIKILNAKWLEEAAR